MRIRRLLQVSLGVMGLALITVLIMAYGSSRLEGQGPLNVTVSLSKPSNGTYLVKGEQAEVTVTLKDTVSPTVMPR